MDLFPDAPICFELPHAEVLYYPSFFYPQTADDWFTQLQQQTPWQQDSITIFGQKHAQPRLTALFGNQDKSYSYSGIMMQPHNWTPLLAQIREAVESICGTGFTSVLLNYYRDGRDSNGWHADNEKELGHNPVIASVSLGAERFFHLRSNADKTLTKKLLLQHGSLLVMRGETQHFWKHQIPKTAKPVGPRINLTFRVIK